MESDTLPSKEMAEWSAPEAAEHEDGLRILARIIARRLERQVQEKVVDIHE